MGQICSIPPNNDFARALARQLLREAGGDRLALADMEIWLPTRRAVLGVREAFLRESEGQALLLPRFRTIGDQEADWTAESGAADTDLPPAMNSVTRAFTLLPLIRATGNSLAPRPVEGESAVPEMGFDHALRMALSLGQVLDQAETEGVDLKDVSSLPIAEHLSAHWQLTLEFLNILTEHWPQVEAGLGAMNPARRRRISLERQIGRWNTSPPERRIIAAGSTGSIPATRDFLATVAALPQGALVLPGLDQSLTDADWQAVREDETHPQYNLLRLLDRCETGPDAVQLWPGAAGPAERSDFLSLALLPALRTGVWRQAGDIDPDALKGFTAIEADGPGEEARTIAVLLRETLETAEQTAALVTPDRTLARRVVLEMQRWGITLDDSAGQPLKNTPSGLLARQLALLTETGFAPTVLLSVLRHPAVCIGGDKPAHNRLTDALEKEILRGPAPSRGIAGLRTCLAARQADARRPMLREELISFAEQLFSTLEGCLPEAAELSLADCLTAHHALLQSLAGSADQAGPEAEALSALFDELSGAAADLPGELTWTAYRACFETFIGTKETRATFGQHPRLRILGTLEGRMQSADRVILGGLNEGTWPGEGDPGPWLSRGMRRALGLPTPERRIGLAAHDFVQALGAPEVYLTRASRVDGAESRPSRWWQRLSVLCDKAGLTFRSTDRAKQVLSWARSLEPARHEPVTGFEQPVGIVPVHRRPQRLSITRFELLRDDPYAIYARDVLGLKKLDPPEMPLSVADRGNIIHEALEKIIARHPEILPPDLEQQLLDLSKPLFDALEAQSPAARAFWWPRFRRVAAWFAKTALDEQREGPAGWKRFVEEKGSLTRNDFELYGRADRIDVNTVTGAARIIDYKTGSAPEVSHMKSLKKPQLLLEAILVLEYAFKNLPQVEAVSELAFWQATGDGSVPVKINRLEESGKQPLSAVIQDAYNWFDELITLYRAPDTPYPAIPDPENAPRYNDYDLLERAEEWTTLPEHEEGEA